MAGLGAQLNVGVKDRKAFFKMSIILAFETKRIEMPSHEKLFPSSFY